jgi:tRNA G18 (ribose-2'-O)-methylase SpoU
VVERLLATDRFTIRSLLLSGAAHAALAPTLAQAAVEPTIFLCRREDFVGLTGMDIHRGCLALVERPRPSTVEEVLDGASTVIALDAVANPDNVGGIFRNAAAFGVDAVLLSPTSCDPLYRKAIRTSMGATLRVPFARVAAWPDALAALRQTGFEIAALTPRRPSQALSDYIKGAPPTRLALLLGAEGTGLSAETEKMADVRLRIAIASDVDSLNVAVAAGIALAQLTGRAPGPGLGGID